MSASTTSVSAAVTLPKAETTILTEHLSATPRPPGARPDRPLDGDPHPYHRLHPHMYLAEFLGTALLLAVGLSFVVALWGRGAPLEHLPISAPQRRLLNGFLFGSVGALIAYSPVGRISGAHINPAVTLAFWLVRKIQWRDASCYFLAQLAGATAGTVCLLAWGAVGASDNWGATLPERTRPIWFAVGGEALCTFMLIVLIFAFAARKRLQPYTPLVNPPLFAILVWLEGPLSGASANPARSFGPELIGVDFTRWWVYWVGPALGVFAAIAAIRLRVIGSHIPHQARLFHFGHPGGIGRHRSTSAEHR